MTALIVSVLTPAVVWLASLALSLAKKSIPDSIMTGIVIPSLAVVAGWLSTVVVPDGAPFMVNVLVGLAATFLHEFTKNTARAISAMWKGEKVARMGDEVA